MAQSTLAGIDIGSEPCGEFETLEYRIVSDGNAFRLDRETNLEMENCNNVLKCEVYRG